MLDKAIKIATDAHQGQTRWDPEVPYITHPTAVADLVRGEDAKVVAMLHDVVEDTDVTLEDLIEEFPEHIVLAIDSMTHREDEGYAQYILRLSDNDLARRVKIADIKHNMSTLPNDNKTVTRVRRERYALALHVLQLNSRGPKRTADSCGGYWKEHEKYTTHKWQYEIRNGNTRAGYWEWVNHQLDNNLDD
jgi:(p)ppGpp synthase/HD superfamily hydrolase